MGRDQAALRAADRHASGQRLLSDIPELDHTRRLHHHRRRRGDRIHRHRRGPRLGQRADSRPSRRRLTAARGDASCCRTCPLPRLITDVDALRAADLPRTDTAFRQPAAERGTAARGSHRRAFLSRRHRLHRRPHDRRRQHHAVRHRVRTPRRRSARSSRCCSRAATSARCSVSLAPISTSTCRWLVPPCRCCAPSCRAIPSMSSTRSWAAPSRARPSVTTRCAATSRNPSMCSCMHQASAAS